MIRRYALFDLDGTLVDSMGVWKHIGEDFLKAKGMTPPKNLGQRVKTMTMMESAAYFRTELGVALRDEEIIDQINEMVIEKYASEVLLKAGVKEFIGQLKEKGIKMCVLTAAERVCVEATLKNNGLLEAFEEILTCTEVGLSKTNSEIFCFAARQLAKKEVSMDEVIVFEDALHAIQMAKEAGAYVVGVFDEMAQKDKKEIESTCDRYITTFKELEDFFE